MTDLGANELVKLRLCRNFPADGFREGVVRWGNIRCLKEDGRKESEGTERGRSTWVLTRVVDLNVLQRSSGVKKDMQSRWRPTIRSA